MNMHQIMVNNLLKHSQVPHPFIQTDWDKLCSEKNQWLRFAVELHSDQIETKVTANQYKCAPSDHLYAMMTQHRTDGSSLCQSDSDRSVGQREAVGEHLFLPRHLPAYTTRFHHPSIIGPRWAAGADACRHWQRDELHRGKGTSPSQRQTTTPRPSEA